MTGLEWFALAVLGAAAVGVGLGLLTKQSGAQRRTTDKK
jgi:hypothetical protein